MAIPLQNPHLVDAPEDFLYHFGLGKSNTNFEEVFGDTKYVCCGGSPGRFTLYAEWFSKHTGLPSSSNLSHTDRFVIYKTGPVLWINHGMGAPSLSIMLVETLKLLHYSKAVDAKIIRVGTSGGVGVEPGTVVISTGAMNGELGNTYVQWINGKRVVREAELDKGLATSLQELAKQMEIPAVSGRTMCADDFYEGQMRMDGFFCEYQQEEKLAFLETIHQKGVRNIEMEATCFAAMTQRAGVKAAIVCVALLNRLHGDQVKIEKEKYIEFEERPFKLVSALIRNDLGI